MAKKKKLSRLEINQMVRRYMQQSNVDLTQLNFSSSMRSIRLYGRLVKNTGKELEVKEVENILRSLETIPGITDLQFDLDNWNISAGSITPKGAKKKKKGGQASATADIGEQNLNYDPSKWDEEERHQERKEKVLVKNKK